MKKVVVIGGGAAGCFAAIEIRRKHPDCEVTLLEAGPKLLAKVAVTGGGRCNLTNTFAGVTSLERVYPRGHQLMKRALRVFSQEDTMRWFEAEGVALVAQPDGCVFPRSQDAMQIVRTLERLLRDTGVRVVLNAKVQSLYQPSLQRAIDLYREMTRIFTGDMTFRSYTDIWRSGRLSQSPKQSVSQQGARCLNSLKC